MHAILEVGRDAYGERELTASQIQPNGLNEDCARGTFKSLGDETGEGYDE